MGLLRFVLAISVVIAHSAPVAGLNLVPGDTAVQAFFIISGFYVSLILNGRYPSSGAGTLLFYSNRFLRIFPLYWLVLAMAAAQSALAYAFPATFVGLPTVARIAEFLSHLDLMQLLFIATTNLMIVGLDLGNFLRFDVTPMQLTAHFTDHSPRFYEFVFVPQSWTLSIEIVVYAIAPFLFRRRAWVLGCLVVASMSARAVAATNGWDHDPFSYRFLPFEITFFLLGAIAFKAYAHTERLKNPLAGQIGLATLMLLILFYDRLPDGASILPGLPVNKLLVLAGVALATPSIFHLTRSSMYDRYIGELSYPIYLCHLIVVTQCNGDFGPLNLYPILGSVIASIALVALVDVPLTRLRDRRVAEFRTV